MKINNLLQRYTKEQINQFVQKKRVEELIKKTPTNFRAFCLLIAEHFDPDVDYTQPTYSMVIDVLQWMSEKRLYVKIDNEYHLCLDLFLNACPGWGKSFLTTFLFNIWIFSTKAKNEHYVVSNSQQTRQKFGNKIQQILDLPIYKKIFNLSINNAVFSKKNDIQSSIDIMSSRSAITGSRGHLFVFDDFLNPAHIRRQEHITTKDFLDMYLTRVFKNPTKHPIRLYVEQRIDFMDVTGYLLPRYIEGKIPYIHIKIPYKFNDNTEYVFYVKQDNGDFKEHQYSFKENTFSCKFFNDELWDTKVLYQECKGNINFRETQYQQKPTHWGNVIIKQEWFQYYVNYNHTKYIKIFITTDTAMKIKQHNDYSVFCVWGVTIENKLYLLDMERGKWEFPDLKQVALRVWNKWKTGINGRPASTFYVEDKTSGTGMIQELRKLGIPILPIQVEKDKYQRVSDILDYIQTGHVYIPRDVKKITEPFLSECCLFTADDSHKHDDIVDCLVYGIQKGLHAGQVSAFDAYLT